MKLRVADVESNSVGAGGHSASALTTGPRLRKAGNVVLVGLPLVANVTIHLSLHAAQSVATHWLTMYHSVMF